MDNMLDLAVCGWRWLSSCRPRLVDAGHAGENSVLHALQVRSDLMPRVPRKNSIDRNTHFVSSIAAFSPQSVGSCDLTDATFRATGSCRKSVLGLDHHCMWLNTCVGKRNYFIFFLLITFGP